MISLGSAVAMELYKEEFPVGTRVQIARPLELQDFRRTWRYHHPLAKEQLDFAGRQATVASVSFYHGGDVPLYAS